jgi:hypothetical protein
MLNTILIIWFLFGFCSIILYHYFEYKTRPEYSITLGKIIGLFVSTIGGLVTFFFLGITTGLFAKKIITFKNPKKTLQMAFSERMKK